jgi:hypothetical protein
VSNALATEPDVERPAGLTPAYQRALAESLGGS